MEVTHVRPFRLTPSRKRTRGGVPGSVVLLIVAYTMLGSFPFVLKVFAPLLYQVGLLALLGVLVVLIAARRSLPVQRGARAAISRPWVAIALAAYAAYLLWTLANTDPSVESLQPIASIALRIVIASLVFCLASDQQIVRSLDLFARTVTVFAVLGIGVVLGVAADVVPVVSTVQIETFGDRDSGVRQFYGLSFGWNRLHISPDIRIPRLQSFSSEAGNFAFAILIALVWSVRRRRWTDVALLMLALPLTWSVGAALTLSTGALYVTIVRLPFRRLKAGPTTAWMLAVATIVFGTVTAAAVTGARVVPAPLKQAWAFLDERYLASKFGQDADVTSLGVRVEGATTIWAEVIQHGAFGFGGLQAVDVSLGVGWLRSMLEGGLIGWSLFLVAFGVVIVRAVWALTFASGHGPYLAAAVLVLAASAFQRAPMDATAWHLWIIVAFLRLATTRDRPEDARASVHASDAPRTRTASATQEHEEPGRPCFEPLGLQ